MIGWYVHHHGRGHLNRASCVAAQLDEPVTVLSSLPESSLEPAATGFDGWVQLESDVDGSVQDGDPTAHGLLHWAPTDSQGLRARMARIASWISEYRPSVLVVDVSVEVCVLARVCGVPVIAIAGPGQRNDSAHQLAYGLADRIIAPWPREVYDPAFLHPHRGKTSYVGAFSRFDARVDDRADRPGRGVFVLNGAGGTTVTSKDLAAAQVATPAQHWTGAGGPDCGWSDDVWNQLVGSGVVVSHAGQNALAEVAASRRPAIVVVQPRPFDEQRSVAAALDRAGLALSLPMWPAPQRWPELLDRALALGGRQWSRWSSGDGARRAAQAIEQTAMTAAKR